MKSNIYAIMVTIDWHQAAYIEYFVTSITVVYSLTKILMVISK